MDFENQGITIIIIFIISSILAWWFSDSLSSWSISANPFLVLTFYLLTTPAYLTLLLSLTYVRKIAGFFASFFIILSFDIISFPHSFSLTMANLFTGSNLFSDSILVQLMPFLTQIGYFGSFILYVLIPVILMLIALEILGIRTFTKIIKGNVGA